MGRMLAALAIAGVPLAAAGQTTSSGVTRPSIGTATANGQQNNQPSPTQNQSQMQTDNSQQPPNARVLPPTADSQNQTNPMPQLKR